MNWKVGALIAGTVVCGLISLEFLLALWGCGQHPLNLTIENDSEITGGSIRVMPLQRETLEVVRQRLSSQETESWWRPLELDAEGRGTVGISFCQRQWFMLPTTYTQHEEVLLIEYQVNGESETRIGSVLIDDVREQREISITLPTP